MMTRKERIVCAIAKLIDQREALIHNLATYTAIYARDEAGHIADLTRDIVTLQSMLREAYDASPNTK